MQYLLSEEQLAFAKTVEAFARKEVAPSAAYRDENDLWDWELWRAMAANDLVGLPVPEQYGGSGASALTTALGFEAFGRGGKDCGLTTSLAAHTIICEMPILLFGNEQQKEKYLTKLATGEWVGAFGLTEPNAGSDAAGLQTTAKKQGDHWVLNGAKTFITNGPIASALVVFAVSNSEPREISAFIVEKDFPGFKVARKLNKMGNRTSPTAELFFDDCVVPAENLLGHAGEGFKITVATLEWERAVFLGGAVGIMEAAVEEAVNYAKTRKQFGQPIAEFQMVREKLANMQVTVEAARLLLYNAAILKDKGISAARQASAAKLFISEGLVRVAEEAVQIHGGYGYMKEYPVERIYRDAKIVTIGGGTSEIQRLVISSAMIH